MREDPAVSLDTLLAQRSWIRALARSLVRDASAVDDIEQDVYVAAMQGPRVETCVRGWLRTVVKNAVYQRHRRDSRRTAREETVVAPRPPRTPAAIVVEADSHRHVVQAVMDLDEPYRTTVLVRYFEGLSLQETADHLGVPRETVKTRMRRAHGMLRERLRRDHGDERGAPAILVPLVGGPEGLADVRRGTPARVQGGRSWLPLAAAAGLIVAVSLVGAAVHASTGVDDGPQGQYGDAGIAFSLPAPAEGDSDVGGDAESESSPAGSPDERQRVGAQRQADDEPVPAVEAPPPPADRFVVRDLYSKEPVPHIALSVTLDAGQMTVATDDDGRIDVAPSDVQRVESGDPSWVVPGAPRPSALVEGVLWVHRMAPVDVTVVDADPGRELDFGSVELMHLIAGVMDMDPRRTGPGSALFNTLTGLDRDQGRTRVGADGRVRMTVPILRGLRVSGVAPGWNTASAEVRFDDALSAAPVRLELTSGISFDGRVTNADGLPVPGTEILMKTARHIDAPQIDLAALRAEGGGGVGLVGSPTKGWDVSWQARVAITPRGIFQGRVTADGDVLLIVTAPGYVPRRVPLGRPTDALHKIEIALKRPDPELRTRLEVNGAPVKQTRVLFHDITSNPQISTYVQTDADGTFPSEMLIEGRRYSVGVRVPGDAPHELRLVTWDGRKTIQVEQLSQDFEGDDE